MRTDYEIRVLQEIADWERSGPGSINAIIDTMGAPISLVVHRIPGPAREAIARAVLGFMAMLKDISYWTFTEKNVLKEASRAGISVDSIAGLAGQDLEALDRIARSYFGSNRVIAALEGAGCGLGGIALIAADIPILFGISFRSIQQIGSSYGFDMQDPAMLPVVMRVFHAGTAMSVAVKSAVLADMHVAAAALAGRAAFDALAKRTKTLFLADLLMKSTQDIPLRIAKDLSGRKLAQIIPVVGAVVGAGFNYWFINNVVVSAYMIFRKLYLERTAAGDGKPPKRSFWASLRVRLLPATND